MFFQRLQTLDQFQTKLRFSKQRTVSTITQIHHLLVVYSPSPRPELAPVMRTTFPWRARRPEVTRRCLRIFAQTATTARVAITAPPLKRLIILPSAGQLLSCHRTITSESYNLLVMMGEKVAATLKGFSTSSVT